MLFDPTAYREESQQRLMLGPPRLYVLDAIAGQGIPPITTAGTTLPNGFTLADRNMLVGSVAAFLNRGAIFITHPDNGTENAFTYEWKDEDDDYLIDVRRLFGPDDEFPEDTVINQWRDITDLVTPDTSLDGVLQGSAGTWTMTLKGDQWNSLIQAPDMCLTVQNRHRNSTFNDLDDPDDWMPWQETARLYFGLVEHRTDKNADATSSEWSVTAYSEDYYLSQIANVPGVYGTEEVLGTDTASSEVKDPTQVPNEGNGTIPPTVAAISDRRRNTSWVSSGTPTLDTPLLARPQNYQVAIPPNPNWAGGLGLRIQQVYPQGYPNLDRSPDLGAWIELYNSMPEENATPYDTAGQPTDENTWGMYDLSTYMLQVQGSILCRLGGPNGLAPGTMLGPGKSCVLVHDRATFLRRWRVPEDCEVYEYGKMDGWYPGQTVGSWVRGAGSYLTMPRTGFYLALRGTYSNDGQWRGFWEDFVACGDIAVPSSFLYKRGEDENLEQNVGGFRAQTVWVTRNPATPWFPGSTPGITVSPTGLSDGTSIRRKFALGGGVFRDDPDDGADGSFNYHDSASSLDWEVLQFPIIGQQAPALSVEWVDRDLGEFPAATVVSDDSDVGAGDQTITVGNGEALEYEESLFPGETIVASGGAVEFGYSWRDANTFHGVRKYRGAGISCAGEELKMRVNVAIDGQKPKWRIANLYALQAIRIERYYTPPSATIVSDQHGTPPYKILVQPGQARRFPNSGVFSVAVSATQITSRMIFSYTSRDDSTFYGVSLISGGDAAIRPGVGLVYSAPASYPDRYRVLIARENSSLDPLTNYGSNPEWFAASALNQGGINDRAFTGTVPLSGNSQRVRRVRVVIEHMSDGGPAALTELKTLRTPRVIISDPHLAGQSRSEPYTGSSVIRDLLLAAGVEPWRLKISGGRPISQERVSTGNVWDTCKQLAEKYGLIITAGPDGYIRVFDDPRLSRTAWSAVPKMVFTPDVIGPDVSVRPLPRHQASQIEITGYNDLTGESWTVRYPTVSNGLGSVRRFPARPANDWNDVVMMARLLWSQANGGADISLSWGQQDNLALGDIVPLRAVIDQAGVKYGQTDLLMTRLSYKFDDRGAWSEGTGREYRGV